MPFTADELLRRHSRLLTERTLWESHWREVAQLVLPRSDFFQGRLLPGDKHWIEIAFHRPARFLQPGRGSVKGELLLPDSRSGVQRNPAIMCDFGFGFRQKTGFGSKLVPFNLSTSS